MSCCKLNGNSVGPLPHAKAPNFSVASARIWVAMPWHASKHNQSSVYLVSAAACTKKYWGKRVKLRYHFVGNHTQRIELAVTALYFQPLEHQKARGFTVHSLQRLHRLDWQCGNSKVGERSLHCDVFVLVLEERVYLPPTRAQKPFAPLRF